MGDAADYINPMIEKNRIIWRTEYQLNLVTAPSRQHRDPIDNLIRGVHRRARPHSQPIDGVTNDFDSYINAEPTELNPDSPLNLFDWWAAYPSASLRQWAFDTLTIPAMSAEIERVFSSSKRTMSATRVRLTNESLEVLQCMKHWMDHGMLEQRSSGPETS